MGGPSSKYPNFDAILYEIKIYKEMHKNVQELEFYNTDLHFENVNFYYQKNILYCDFLTDRYSEIPQNTTHAKNATKFGKYISENSFISEVQYVCYSENRPIRKIKMSLHEIHFGKQDKVNIAFLPCYQNLVRLDNAIEFGPMQGHFRLNNINFSIYFVCNDGRYLAVSSDKPLITNEFNKYLMAIKTAFDFVNCEVTDGDVFFFLTNDDYSQVKNMSVKPISSKAKLYFDIFINNSYPLTVAFKNIYGNEAMYLTAEQFGKLCQLLWKEKQMQAAVNYILQSANLWLEYQLVFLSVALEAISKYCNASSKLLKAARFLKLKQDIANLVNTQQDIAENERNTIIGKIQNSKSNKDMLKAPFDENNIKIYADDEKILKKRNEILHGTAPEYSDNVDDDIKEYCKEIKILHSLLYRLILKLTGYNGYILNLKEWDKIQEYHNKFSMSQTTKDCKDFFVKI